MTSDSRLNVSQISRVLRFEIKGEIQKISSGNKEVII